MLVFSRLTPRNKPTRNSETEYFESLRELYNQRNPHAMIGEFSDPDEVEFIDDPSIVSDDEPT